MARIFPAFLLAGPALIFGRDLLQRRQLDRKLISLFVSFSLSCAVAVPMGALNARGLDSWVQFVDNITLHSEHHYLGPQRMGLQKVFAYDFDSMELPQSRHERIDQYAALRGAHGAATVLLLALFVVVVLRRSRQEAMLLSLCVPFFGLVLSRYYWVLWGLLLLLREEDPHAATPPSRWQGAASDMAVLAILPAFYAARAVEQAPMLHYQFINIVMLAVLLGLLVGYLGQDIQAWRAEKRRAGDR